MRDWIREVAEPQIALRAEIAQSKTMLDVDKAVSQGGGKKIFNELRGLMDRFRTEELKLLELRTQAAQATETDAHRVIVIGTALTIVATLIILVLLTGAVSRPLMSAMRLAESIQKGDLTRRMNVRANDEVGRLCLALNGMVDVLGNQAKETLEAVTILSSSATEISTTVFTTGHINGKNFFGRDRNFRDCGTGEAISPCLQRAGQECLPGSAEGGARFRRRQKSHRRHDESDAPHQGTDGIDWRDRRKTQ